MKKVRGQRIVWICMAALTAVLSWSIAWADFYVVGSGKRAKKTILVSPKSTETASGTALLNTMNGITDAGVTNPYLIIIEPGIYDIGSNSLQMKEYLDIQGAGEDVTKISGNTSSLSSGVLDGADNAEVRFLTVENTGGGTYAHAIYNSSVSPAITNVTATASGGTYNYGIGNINSSSPTMTNVTATASGGSGTFGIYNYSSSSPTMTNVTASASGGTYNYGVLNNIYSSPTMTDVTASASGGTDNYGVRNENSSSPTMTNVTASASGGSGLDYGVYITNSSNATIEHSVLSGDNDALFITSSGLTTYISNTRITGGVGGAGISICACVYDGALTFYADTCP